MALRRALHFVFKIGDRAKTATFYRDVLGMKVCVCKVEELRILPCYVVTKGLFFCVKLTVFIYCRFYAMKNLRKGVKRRAMGI